MIEEPFIRPLSLLCKIRKVLPRDISPLPIGRDETISALCRLVDERNTALHKLESLERFLDDAYGNDIGCMNLIDSIRDILVKK